MWTRLSFCSEIPSHTTYRPVFVIWKSICFFGFVVSCCPEEGENPECIAPEGADGGASKGGGARDDNWQGEEPVVASAVPARQHTTPAEGVYLFVENVQTTEHSTTSHEKSVIYIFFSILIFLSFFHELLPSCSILFPPFEKIIRVDHMGTDKSMCFPENMCQIFQNSFCDFQEFQTRSSHFISLFSVWWHSG